MKNKKVHVIPHTHWDREWYFNTSRSTIYLIKHIKEVLEVLENDENYHSYILDAQTSLVEDYLEYHPEDRDRIKQLVENKRLFIGPWYTQTDQLVISQESIVRNLLYGINKAREFGHSFDVGYVPDAFGQGGNMPQIYKSFGIDTAVFWRGVADSTFSDTQFIWEGADGSQVYTNIMRNGYHFGGEFGIPENPENQEEYIEKFVGELEENSNTDHIYYAYGHDQAPIRENLPELVEQFNALDKNREYVMSNPNIFFKEMIEDNQGDFNVLQGELTQAKHSRIHKSIFSTRADMKQLNNKIENYIVNTLEPVLVIADSLGIPYPHSVLEKIWKLMFENAAHDSIGGCNSDSTNRDILHRYKVARDLSKNLLEITMRSISAKVQFDHELNYLYFNPLPYQHNGIIEIEAYVPNLDFSIFDAETDKEVDYVIEEAEDLTEYVLKQTIKIDSSKEIYIPEKVYLVKLKFEAKNMAGLGYKSLYINPDKQSTNSNEYKTEKEFRIDNKKYAIELNNNNTLTIIDKESNQVYKDQMVLVDSGDDGDSYNFSPPRKDFLVTSVDADRISANVYTNKLNERLEFSFNMNVPYNLEERANGKVSTDLPIEIIVELPKDSDVIKFAVNIDNTVLSHKLVVQFDTSIASEISFADQIFGPIERPVKLNELDVWEEEDWDETPISIEPMQNYVALSDEKQTYAVITEGIREYEIVGGSGSIIQLTLFRTFGYMGKENLLYRPGRASGETIVETPDAQLLGSLSCDFGVHINGSQNIQDINLSKISKEFLTTFPSYQYSEFLNGRMIFSQKRQNEHLAKSYSILDLELENLGISAIKKSENNQNYILRIFNPYFNKNIELSKEIKQMEFVELDEVQHKEKTNTLPQNKFATLKFDIEE